jgi:hypothetical protein
MPRYLIESGSQPRAHVGEAIELAAQRFPEIAVEQCYAERDASDARLFWVCRAPSVAHIDRWAVAAQLRLTSLCLVDAVAEYATATGEITR